MRIGGITNSWKRGKAARRRDKMTRNEIRDFAARFEISATECDRIAAQSANEKEFITIWENTDWWTDANN